MKHIGWEHLPELQLCKACGEIISKIEIVQSLAGTRTEPPEYIGVCPECGAEESWGTLPKPKEEPAK